MRLFAIRDKGTGKYYKPIMGITVSGSELEADYIEGEKRGTVTLRIEPIEPCSECSEYELDYYFCPNCGRRFP